MGADGRGGRSGDWPYEHEELVDPPPSGPSWACPDGMCDCHALKDGEPMELTVLLCDEHARPIPHARCRVIYGRDVINADRPNADAEGWLSIVVRRPTRVLTLEWAPPEVPLAPRYPYRMRYQVDLRPDNPRASVKRRLQNLGFSERGVLEENVKDFQRAFGYENITGAVEDIRADLLLFHDRGWIPPIEEGAGDDEDDQEQEDQEGDTDSAQGGGDPFQAFPGDKAGAKPKPQRKRGPKAAPHPRAEPSKKHKPAAPPTGTGTARPAAKGKLAVHVCCLFSTVKRNGDIDTRCRWDEEKKNPHPANGASIELFDMQSNVVPAFAAANPSPRTNRLGQVTLRLGSLSDGQYVLRLNPPLGHDLRGAMPGPITDDAIRETQLRSVGPGDNFPNDPPEHRRFRILEIAIRVKNGALKEASVLPSMRRPADVAFHGVVVDAKPSVLKIDWKPDWIRCRFFEGTKKRQPDPRDPTNKKLARVHFIVLHHTDATTPGSTINEFTVPKKDTEEEKDETGAHYLVDVDGHVIKLADEDDHVPHAGRCFWHGVDSSTAEATKARFNWNDFSVGIEHVHKIGDYRDTQSVATKNLIERIQKAHKTSPHNVLGHNEIAIHPPPHPKRLGRKLPCPGDAYDWPILESAGCVTVPASGVVDHARYNNFFLHHPGGALNGLGVSTVSSEVLGLQITLAELGYFVDKTGRYDEPTIRAVEAFQVRHFSGRFRKAHQSRVMQNRVRLANLVTIQKMHDVLAACAGFTY